MGATSFSNNDWSLSLCETINSASSSSSSDILTACKHSKSLPELDSAGETDGKQQKHSSSVEGVVMQQKSSSPTEELITIKSGSSGTHSKKPSPPSNLQQQTHLYSTPPAQGMHGTLPLSHTPSTLSKMSMNITGSQFSMPQMDYSQMHHTASHGGMYTGFPSYQPYDSASPEMPLQAACPPSYNSYSDGSHLSYMGPAGSNLYNTDSLIQSPYSMHPNILNSMPYADNKQHYNSSALVSYNTQQEYPCSTIATGGVDVIPGSSTSAAAGSYFSLPAIASSSQELRCSSTSTSLLPHTHSNIPTSVGPINTSCLKLALCDDRGHSGSPQEIKRLLDSVFGCNSPKSGQEASAESREVYNCDGAEDMNRVLEHQHYIFRYIHVHKI